MINMEDQIPDMQCVPVDTLEELCQIAQKMSKMQGVHNKLAEDFEVLVGIANENLKDEKRIKPLIRACIKEFFSLVEGDLFLINQYLPYKGYDDKDKLNEKFKRTFRHHAESFKKQGVKEAYQSRSYGRLYSLKMKRDAIVHPKNIKDIDVAHEDLDKVICVYDEYSKYIEQLMRNIGFSSNMSM